MMVMRATRARAASLILLLAMAICISAPSHAAESRAEAERKPVTLFLNSHESARFDAASKAHLYEFTPAIDGDYTFRTFRNDSSSEIELTAALFRGEAEQISNASGAGYVSVTAPLSANARYTFSISGKGTADLSVEVMLNAHGRCFSAPIELTAETTRYAKKITRPRDAHWFTFDAIKDGVYAIRSETVDATPLDVRAYLFDEEGVLLDYNDDVFDMGDPNFAIYAELKAGRRYYIKVSALSVYTGIYRLAVIMPNEGESAPESVSLSAASIELEPGKAVELYALIEPQGACGDVMWLSSNYAVAHVSPDGLISAISPGEAIVTALACGGIRASCLVTVPPVPLDHIAFTRDLISLTEGGVEALELLYYPYDATNRSVSYASSDPLVVTVDADGVIYGLSEGSAIVTAVSAEGQYATRADISVTARQPHYRALIVSEQIYVDGRNRVGAINSAQGLADALSHHMSQGASYETRLELDITREQLISAIEAVFAGARKGDLSLLYISGHGESEDGVSYIELHDGDRVTMPEIGSMLREIQGNVVLLLDFCKSGSFISNAAFERGDFFVMASAAAEEDSNRMGGGREFNTATAFTLSLCEGLGYDIIKKTRTLALADANMDRKVTFAELFQYTFDRVNERLDAYNERALELNHRHAPIRQTVQALSAGADLIIFERPPISP
jgi:hypothetical protein